MSLRDVMAYVQKQQSAGAGVTPVTPANSTGLQPQPAWIGRVPPVTPVTPHSDEVGCNVQSEGAGATPVQLTPHQRGITFCSKLKGPVPEPGQRPANTAPAPEHPAAVAWHALDMAYQAHHFKCPICIAAGRGVRYGLRCGVGAALWADYEHAGQQPGAVPWIKPKKGQRHD